ncbi:hypothetical protein [Paraburkholderia sp.]|uniref:hypothetical protein n=1 Tax=Paraburkholderia sp. TaxID=1926495 RepID=UPI002398F78C|nr:hypothetical protein [Paraburkholderia sp.]MDE1181270.1 hypothetical protein [Paraburkholderia sp.]
MNTLQFLTRQEIFDRAVGHLFTQSRAAHVARGASTYRGYCGGCPVGSLIRPIDYVTAIDGVPVRYVSRNVESVPTYMVNGVSALKRALLRARVNVYDPVTVDLLSCLQNVHDMSGKWEWTESLNSIARQFQLSADRVKSAA